MMDPVRRSIRASTQARSSLLAGFMGLLFVALLFAHTPQAEAQNEAIMTATAWVERVVPIRDLDVGQNSDNANPTECSMANVEADAEKQRFTFRDQATRRMCGRAIYTFDVPPGAANFTVHFSADRHVSNTTTASAQQILRLTHADQDQSEITSYAYFDSTEVGDFAMRPFQFLFRAPTGAERLNLVWYFEDAGNQLINHPVTKFSATSFNATVQSPEIHFASLPLEPGVATDSFTTETNGTRVTTTNATIDVPDLLSHTNDRAEVSIRILNSDRLVAIRSPQGVPLNLGRIEAVPEGTQVTIRFDTDILRNIGPGAYTFTFERTETLPPPAAPPPPATIFPLVYLLSLLPAPTAIYAYTQVWRVRRFSDGGLGRTAGLYIGTAALTLAYAGLLGFLYLTGNLRPVATLPVGTLGVFVFTGFIVLAVAFILLGALVARSVLRALKRDLDERRRIQKELERSNQELEHFAYVASHDLQEPLRTISGFSQLLKKRYEGELDERAVRYITRTVEGTDRMSRLIHDLLEYSRVDSRGRPLEPTDLNRLVDDVKQDLETLIESSGAKVTHDHLPTVQADPTQLTQVLSNLVRNSIKYRHPDRNPEVHISSSQQDGAWMISVADNGMGIPEDQQERAFVIFQRLVPRETDDTGTGLGLAISRKIVERHAGQIWVESDGASGSTFRFTLPRDASVSVNGAGPKPKRKVKPRRQRGNRAPA